MCTGGGRKPTSCANFLRTPLMRAEQVALARLVDQRDQPVADLEAERVDRLQVVPARLGVRPRAARGGGVRRVLRRAAARLCSHQAPQPRPPAISRNTRCGMPGMTPSTPSTPAAIAERARRAEHLLRDLAADVVLLADARHHHRRGDRDQQRRDLRDQRVADREQDVAVGRLRRRQVVLRDADDEAADDVDEQDQHAGDRVAAHELDWRRPSSRRTRPRRRLRRGGAWLPSRRSGRRSGRRRSPSACRASRRA